MSTPRAWWISEPIKGAHRRTPTTVRPMDLHLPNEVPPANSSAHLHEPWVKVIEAYQAFDLMERMYRHLKGITDGNTNDATADIIDDMLRYEDFKKELGVK